MGKANARLDAARKAYREALEAARKSPTPECWSRLLAAGKELSAEERPRSRRGRRGARRPTELADSVDTTGEPVEGPD